MANVDNPHGFRLLNGVCVKPPTAYRIESALDSGTAYATALYIGDPVVLSSGYLIKATAGTANQILGVIVGFECDAGLKGGGYYPASSAYNWKALVADDPAQRFIVQDDSSGTLTIANMGGTVNVVFTHAGNTSTNLSGAEIVSSAVSGAVTDQCRIVGIVDIPGNAWGAAGEYIVEIHNHQLRQENNVDAVT